MKTRQLTIAAAAIAAILAAPLAAAAQPGEISTDRQYVYVGGEEGWVNRPHEYSFQDGLLVRSDDRDFSTPAPKDRLPPQAGEISADGQYVFQGGDDGWVPRPHDYVLHNGVLVHSDNLDRNTPAPNNRLPPQPGEISADQNYVFRGGEEGWVPRNPAGRHL